MAKINFYISIFEDMINYKRFIFVVVGVLLVLLTVYVGVFEFSVHKGNKYASWVKNMYQYKDYVADRIEGKKIILASGSNSLFGINSLAIEKTTGLKVANLAVHANLGLNFLYYKIEQHINDNDIVILPLEFDYYYRQNESGEFYSHIMQWGYYDYLLKLSLFDYLVFITNVQKRSILAMAINKVSYDVFGKINASSVGLSDGDVLDDMKKIFKSGEGHIWKGYSHKSLNLYGDINIDVSGPTVDVMKLHSNGIPYLENLEISKSFVSGYHKIKRMVDKKQGKLILTWPVTIKNKMLDMSKTNHRLKVEKFTNKLSNKYIEIFCELSDFNLDVKYFHDTYYHLNKRGAILRSSNLAKCINGIVY